MDNNGGGYTPPEKTQGEKMFFGKYTIEVDRMYLENLPDGVFFGHSVLVGKVFIGNFRKVAKYQSINDEKYAAAYNSCSSELSHNHRDSYARNHSMESRQSRFIQPYYAEIRAYWDGKRWQYSEVKDTDLTTNSDGIRLNGKIVEKADDPFAW